jgi:putative nucleotidyltransferase with HDIG domain
MLSREEAEKLLKWADEQNPGPWVHHSRIVARAAETIAKQSNLDSDRAYISGLLHDIGYYSYRNGKGKTNHTYAGYELMMKNNDETIARICLTHSFPYQDIKAYGGSDMNCIDEELAFIKAFLSEITYNDYDKLIQLCDCLVIEKGVCSILEKRMVDVVRRHGFNDFTLKKWDIYFSIKEYFDKLCGKNIYDLIY